MTFTLYNDQEIVLKAEIADGSWHSDERPVTYTGDTSLIVVAPVRLTPSFLCGFFNSAASDHQLRMGGDWERFMFRDDVISRKE